VIVDTESSVRLGTASAALHNRAAGMLDIIEVLAGFKLPWSSGGSAFNYTVSAQAT
jgi:hypothetical protein